MNNKFQKTFLIAGIALLFLISFTTAAASLDVQSKSISQSDTQTNITITNNGDQNITTSISLSIESYPSEISQPVLSISSIPSLDAGDSEIITVNFGDISDLEMGDYEIVVKAQSGVISDTGSITYSNNNYCEYDNDGDLSINIEDIVVRGIKGMSVLGDDDTQWFPLETIEIEVEVEANSYDIQDVELEWCLYDTENSECVMEDTESDFDVDDGDTETITISFTIDPEELDSDVENYRFYVRATGEIDDSDADEYDGDNTCDSDYDSVEIIIDKDLVVLDDIKYPEKIQCDAEFNLDADVWNIGSRDQDDVSLRLVIEEFSISREIEIGDVDSFEDERLSTSIKIPEDAEEGSYSMKVWVMDEDGDNYESSEDTTIYYFFPLVVEGGCQVIPEKPQASISASLESGGSAGKELIVKAMVTNIGSETTLFNINVAGFSEWASLEEFSPEQISLNAGQSGEVSIKFNVNEDIEGDQSFNIELTTQESPQTLRQPVTVTIIKDSGFSFPSITGFSINSDNWYLWGIGFLNFILVLVIIFVIIRIMKN